MYYGGDYNPEQWDRQTWRDDVARMLEAQVNLVTVGVFAWSRIQPREGVFDWDWLDEVLDLLHTAGIGVDLATPTASLPPWAVVEYPDILAWDESGNRYWPGSRQYHAPTSPDYRRLARTLVQEIAQRYAHHPAVRLWHVGNEFGCHLTYDYSDHAQRAFQEWLRAKYGTVEALNQAWGTAFWSQLYGDFAEIFPPRQTPYFHNPAGVLDFRRFSSQVLLDLFVAERDLIRAAGAQQPVTTNLMGAFPNLDYWHWSPELDLISDDTYPDPNDPDAWLSTAFTRSLVRSLKPGTPWLVMEQATGSINNRPTNAAKAPGQLESFGMQSVGHGADGLLFFQWRQSRHGAEMFHSAMLPHSGTRTRLWREVTEFGERLAALPHLPAATRSARMALVWEWESWWALDLPSNPVQIDYESAVRRWHSAATRLHLPVDLVPAGADLGGYALVIAPLLHLLGDSDAANLLGYVDAGGCLLVTAFSDVVDENVSLRPGGYTAALRPVLGLQVEDFGALVPPGGGFGPGPDQVAVQAAFGAVGSFRGELLAETLVLQGAEVLGSFGSGPSEGGPALTRNAYGEGEAYYVATLPDAGGTTALVAELAARRGIAPVLPSLPEAGDLEVTLRGDVAVLINHGREEVMALVTGRNLATGDEVTSVSLKPFAWALVQLPSGSDQAIGEA